MKRILFLMLLILAASAGWAQTTKVDATRLLKPSGTNSELMVTDGSGGVDWVNLASIATAGTGISLSGNQITNSAPDQTVAFTGTGITGTYPNFTIDAELSGLAGLTGTGFVVKTGAGTFVERSFATSASDAGLSLGLGNADGVSGNTTLSVSTGSYAYKQSARVVATSNITLSGNQTIDGVATATNDRVLVVGQSTASANGLYASATGAWSRVTDFDGSTEMPNGAVIYVEEGTAQGESVWALTTDGSITVGSTSLTFKRLGRANQATAGTYGSATQVPVFTLNDDGTIAGTVTNTTITHPALSAGDGSGSDRTIILGSPGSGTVTLAQGSGITLTRSSNTITIAAAASAPTITVQRYEEISTGGQTTCTVSGFTPLTTDTMVFVDGVHLDWGAGEDITLSGSVITFLTALVANQKIIVKKITAS